MNSILDEAKSLIYGDRHEDYGNAAVEFSRVADMWSAIIGHEVQARHVPLCMAALKLVREAHKSKRDNRTDICGYLALLDDMEKPKSTP